MRQEYISLTTAIELFEQYKCDETIIIKDPDFMGSLEGSILSHRDNESDNDITFELIKPQYNLLDFIFRDHKIVLMGKKILNNTMVEIDLTYLKNVWWLGKLVIAPLSDACHLRNSYDYQTSYNPATNYDVLCLNDAIIYTELSILYKDFVELVREIYPPRKSKKLSI